MFFICGMSNAWHEILKRGFNGFNNIKSKAPVLIISGSLFNPGTIAKVNTESVNPP